MITGRPLVFDVEDAVPEWAGAPTASSHDAASDDERAADRARRRMERLVRYIDD